MLYAVFGAMLLFALLSIALPLYKTDNRISTNLISAMAVVVLLSIFVYHQIGTPDAKSEQAGDLPDIEAMVASLAERLQQNPDDLAGWKMLGRSYLQLKNFPAAVAAIERAVEIEAGRNGQTLADLGEALLLGDGRTLNGRARQLFENSIAVAPGNQKALFYLGMAAVERGDKELAADYWETLLASSPPERIQTILHQQIAELRGEDVPVAAAAQDGVVTVSVSLDESAAAAVSPGSVVFIIARDPAQPSPPIAAIRRQVSELPAKIAIGDSDAMIPGRVPSAFAQLEIVARVSMSGQPIAQAGDWFGQQIVSTAEFAAVTIIIDTQVR